MLAQIVVDQQNVFSLFHKIFAHRASRVRSDVLERAGFGSGRRYDDRIIHRSVLRKRLHKGGHCRTLLSDSHIDTDHVLALLVDDRIQGKCGFSGLAVADDQLTLSSADRDHGVDRLDTGLQRFFDRLPVADSGSRTLHRTELRRLDRPVAVDRLSQSVDDSSDHRIADGDGHDFAGTFYRLAFADLLIVAENNDRNAVLLQVLRHAEASVFKFQQLAGHTV